MDHQAHPTIAMPPITEMRAGQRWAVRLPAMLRSGAGVHLSVEMSDISESGCQIRACAELEEGSRITLAIPSFTSFEAEVMWAEDDAMGLRFIKRLHPMILGRLLEQSR